MDGSSEASITDFDLHGFVRIRVVGGSPADVAAVRAQLGPIDGAFDGEPDILIRFVDRFAPTAMRYLGDGDAGFDGDGFYVLRGPRKSSTMVRVTMDRIGGRCEYVCETGTPAVPLLIAAVNQAALAHGVLPVHGTAFRHRGKGILVMGWAKGGKTETLLGFMTAGAEYVADEWVYLDGDRLYGIPEPITVWNYQLREVPSYRSRLTGAERARLGATQLATRLAAPVARRSGAVRRLTRLAEGRLHVRADPTRLFGEGAGNRVGTLDHVVLVMSHSEPDIVVESIDAAEIGRRMAFSLQYERLGLLGTYLEYRFAFPGSPNPSLEGAAEVERTLADRILAGKPAHVAYHPFPAPIPALFEAIEAAVFA